MLLLVKTCEQQGVGLLDSHLETEWFGSMWMVRRTEMMYDVHWWWNAVLMSGVHWLCHGTEWMSGIHWLCRGTEWMLGVRWLSTEWMSGVRWLCCGTEWMSGVRWLCRGTEWELVVEQMLVDQYLLVPMKTFG